MDSLSSKLSKYIQPGKVFIFSTTYCPYCVQAKKLLSNYEIPFEYVEVDNDPNLKSDNDFIKELQTHSKIDTYPKVYIGVNCIGGFTDLNKLVKNMKLFSMLKKEGVPFPDSDEVKF